MRRMRKLIDVANSLDAQGLTKEAEVIDSILRKMAMDDFDDDDFGPSDSELQAMELGLYDPVEEDRKSTLQQMVDKLQKEMKGFALAISSGLVDHPDDWGTYFKIQDDLAAIKDEVDRSAALDNRSYEA